jgi:hypothetical protein
MSQPSVPECFFCFSVYLKRKLGNSKVSAMFFFKRGRAWFDRPVACALRALGAKGTRTRPSRHQLRMRTLVTRENSGQDRRTALFQLDATQASRV